MEYLEDDDDNVDMTIKKHVVEETPTFNFADVHEDGNNIVVLFTLSTAQGMPVK